VQPEISKGSIVSSPKREPLVRQLFWGVLILPVAMFIAFGFHNLYLLDFTHVLSGCLWTGTDIFLGFFIGPVMGRLTAEQRKAIMKWLTPKTILYLPVLAITTGTCGWVMANWDGYLKSTDPERFWIYGALIIITILTVQGFGFILPNEIRAYLEIQKESPDVDKLTRFARTINRLAGVQGIFQIAIILVMAQLATS
jgi:hypothetical protein